MENVILTSEEIATITKIVSDATEKLPMVITAEEFSIAMVKCFKAGYGKGYSDGQDSIEERSEFE